MTTIILVTGHPATGKTTLAHYLARELSFPLIWKDQFKETLSEILGAPTAERSRRLSSVAWALLYQQVENLLKANISHVVESNFDPFYANEHWINLKEKYEFKIIQIRCETQPEILLERYKKRVLDGSRHHGHVDASKDKEFLKSIEEHIEWVEIESDSISFDTSSFNDVDKEKLLKKIRKCLGENR
jgi:predicted kinase